MGLGDPSAPQTYIIAQNPAVLAQLMRENENRPLNPSAYTTPASVFNTLAVDIDLDPSKADPSIIQEAPVLPLKTVILPASELSKLDPIVDEEQLVLQPANDEDQSASSSKASTLDRYNVPQDALLKHGLSMSQSQDAQMSSGLSHSNPQSQPPNYPIPCEIINALTQQIHSIDPMYKALQATNINTNPTNEPHETILIQNQQQQQLLHQGQPHLPNNIIYTPSGATFFHQNACQNVPYSPGLPPPSDASQKSRSLERNMSGNVTYASRISSLDRMQNAVQLKQTRSNSLTRQMSSGSNEITMISPGCTGSFMMNARSASLERGGRIGAYGCRTNSLERNNPQLQMQQSMSNASDIHRGGSLERNQPSAYELMKRSYRGGSLERNHQAAMVNRSASLERNAQYHQIYRDACKPSNSETVEPFQEEIYDFGGANVKSCASIALNKSISKGLIPAGTVLPAVQQQQQQLPQQQHIQHQPPWKKVDSHFDGYQNENPPLSPQPSHSNQSQHSQYAALNIKPQPNAGLPPTHNLPPSPYLAQAYTPNSVYTPMYPLMWSQQNQAVGPTHLVYVQHPPTQQQQSVLSNSAQLSTSSQMVAPPPLQLTQIPISLCVNNSSQNAILDNGSNVATAVNDTASIVDSNGFVAQVWTQRYSLFVFSQFFSHTHPHTLFVVTARCC